MEAMNINSKLEIVKLKEVKFYNSKNEYVVFTGHALYVKGMGYIRFKDSGNAQSDEFKTPYNPKGGRKALKDIIKGGGFTSYDDLEFVNN